MCREKNARPSRGAHHPLRPLPDRRDEQDTGTAWGRGAGTDIHAASDRGRCRLTAGDRRASQHVAGASQSQDGLCRWAARPPKAVRPIKRQRASKLRFLACESGRPLLAFRRGRALRRPSQVAHGGRDVERTLPVMQVRSVPGRLPSKSEASSHQRPMPAALPLGPPPTRHPAGSAALACVSTAAIYPVGPVDVQRVRLSSAICPQPP